MTDRDRDYFLPEAEEEIEEVSELGPEPDVRDVEISGGATLAISLGPDVQRDLDFARARAFDANSHDADFQFPIPTNR